MDDIINAVIKLLAILLGVGLAYLGKLIAVWIKGRFEEREFEKLRDFISTFVAAAEQLYYHCDDTGSIRRNYVTDQLVALGYEITDTIYNLLESKVFEINLAKQATKENNGE